MTPAAFAIAAYLARSSLRNRANSSGELPIGSGDGVAFFASSDDAGRALDGRCMVTIAGTTPAARFWTITLYDLDGRLIPNAADRYGFTSQEIARRADGTFEILVAPRARPGKSCRRTRPR